MKETIAKRNKTNFLIMLGISVLAILICVVNLLTQPNLKVVYIVGICVFGVASVVWLIFIIDPRPVIQRRDAQLVVRLGLFKNAGINIKDIMEVCLTPDQKNKGKVLGDCVTIKYMVKRKPGQIDCGGIIDAPAVVEKIKGLMR